MRMKTRTALLAGSAAVCADFAESAADGPLTADEVRRLLIGKAVVHDDVTYVFKSDGKFDASAGRTSHVGRFRIETDGRLCWQDEFSLSGCFQYYRRGDALRVRDAAKGTDIGAVKVAGTQTAQAQAPSAVVQRVPGPEVRGLPVGAGFPGGKTIDIAGFHLGMDGARARGLLAQHYKSQKTKPSFIMAKLPFSNDSFLRAVTGSDYSSDITYDNIYALFSSPASGNQAFLIRRTARFTGDRRPDREATIAAIRQKFGEPTDIVGTNRMRFFFAKGQRVSKEQQPDYQSCGASAPNSIANLGNNGQHHGEETISSILSITREVARATGSGACDIVVEVWWETATQIVQGQIVNLDHLITRLEIMAFDHARFSATNDADQQAMQALQDGAVKSVAPGRAAPKL